MAVLLAFAWLCLSIYLSENWLNDLSMLIGYYPALLVITFIAYVPGFMYMFLLAAYLLDRSVRVNIKPLTQFPGVTVLVSAYNEEKSIEKTIRSIINSQYQGPIEIIAIDDGSKDRTYQILQELKQEISNLIVLEGTHGGKARALNTGLAQASHELIVTVDADTQLLSDAIYQIVAYLYSVPADTAAVAGAVYASNSGASFMAEIIQWEFAHSITAIKRSQGLLQGTLVAQGCFSIYRKKVLNEVGGWAHTVGEDIVLTWEMLDRDYRVTYADQAICLTSVPTTYKNFFYQRSRWARGMLEAFRNSPRILFKFRLSTFIIYWDLLFPLIDFTYLFIFIPGVIAAFFGYFFIAGPMTLAVLPLALIQNLIFYMVQRKIFKAHNLHFKRGFLSFLVFVLLYSPMMVVSCIHGYFAEVFDVAKTWGTK